HLGGESRQSDLLPRKTISKLQIGRAALVRELLFLFRRHYKAATETCRKCPCRVKQTTLFAMAYKDVTPPAGGKISIANGKLNVPDNPILPFIRGDGTGPDIWAASERVFDEAVKKAYGGKRKIAWFEVFAGETAKNKFDNWLPDDTVEAFKEYLVGIKGPL